MLGISQATTSNYLLLCSSFSMQSAIELKILGNLIYLVYSICPRYITQIAVKNWAASVIAQLYI